MRTRLLAIDLDGTLLTDQRQPHPRSVEALKRANDAGIQIALASGRIVPSIQGYSEQFGIPLTFIAGNGAHVVGPGGKEIVHWPLPIEGFELVHQYAVEQSLHEVVYTRDQVIFFNDSSLGDTYRSRERTIEPVIRSVAEARSLALSKILLMADVATIRKAIADLAPLIDSTKLRITESEPEYLEFMHPKSNKAVGLATLASYLGLQSKECAAVGDYLNDLEMIQWSGRGGAMANGHPTVRAAADVVVGSNNEGGVADFIDYLMQNKIE